MISSLAWVPAGCAAPNPKKYELSRAEQELVQMMQEKGNLDEFFEEEATKIQAKSKIALPKIDSSTLPADLRMDEYSSDDEDDEQKQGVALGQILVGVGEDGEPSAEMLEEEAAFENADGEDQSHQHLTRKVKDNADSDDDDDEHSDDDLADIPDTREFEAVDPEDLQAMKISHVGTNGGGTMLDDEEDDESEAEDVRITPDDAMVVVGKTEDDFASLEVHVYDQKTGNLYVHHDIPLPAFPLCLAHGQVSTNGVTGNFCAVGTFNPGIEIWNLDVLNALEPSCVLGGEDTSVADDLMKLQIMNAARGKSLAEHELTSKSGGGGVRPGSHVDAVIALSWNDIHKQVIASGSADQTVKLWDVTQGSNASTFSHHRDKVQSVAWNPKEGTLLATASYDRTMALVDARSSGDSSKVKSVKIGADCEAIAWDPFHPERLTVVTEDGTISCFDVRQFQTSKPLWSFVANEFGGINDLSYNTQVPGLMVTCSVDKSVALWDANSTQTTTDKKNSMMPPRLCGSKDLCAGKLYAVDFYPSSPWLLGCGGSGNMLALWDLSRESTIQKRFRPRMESSQGIFAESLPADEQNKDDFEVMMKEKDDTRSLDAANPKKKSDDRKKKKGRGKAKRKAHRKS